MHTEEVMLYKSSAQYARPTYNILKKLLYISYKLSTSSPIKTALISLFEIVIFLPHIMF